MNLQTLREVVQAQERRVEADVYKRHSVFRKQNAGKNKTNSPTVKVTMCTLGPCFQEASLMAQKSTVGYETSPSALVPPRERWAAAQRGCDSSEQRPFPHRASR